MKSPIIERLFKEPGSQTRLAAALGLTVSAVNQWKNVPPLRVIEVERITGIPRHELRPDLYPTKEAA